MPSSLFTKSGWAAKSGGARALVATIAALLFVSFAPTAQADDLAPGSALITGGAVPVRVALDRPRELGATPVALRDLLTRPETVAKAGEVRLDGALFAGLATAGLVVAERPGADAPAPRPVAGLSPRLLRGGGVVCDVRVSF